MEGDNGDNNQEEIHKTQIQRIQRCEYTHQQDQQ